MTHSLHTAAQLAAILGVTPRAVRAQLEDVTPAGNVTARGIPAAAWSFDQLTSEIAGALLGAWRAAEAVAAAQPWRDLAHFLSDPPPPVKTKIPAATSRLGPAWKETDFEPLAFAVDGLSPERTPGEVAHVWHTAFEVLAAVVASGRSEKRFKRALERWLADHVAFLDCSRRTLNRNLAAWRQGGCKAAALIDGRQDANAKRRKQLIQQDYDRLLFEALSNHGGELSPAWRELRDSASLTVHQSHIANPSRKSYVPAAVRRAISPEIKSLLPLQRGPRQAKLNGAFMIRDWSKVAAGDWFSSDDFTLEIYFGLPDGTLTRGQFLPLVDCRSKRVLEFLLIPEKNYTGLHIRTLINHVGRRIGLPREGYQFECGSWKKSKMVGGVVPDGEFETNFADRLGLRISHALPGNARAKIVENIGKLLQAGLRDVPGWVGNNEQVLKIEAVQAAKAEVNSGHKSPEEAGFLSYDGFVRKLHEKVEAYNSTPQESRVIGGNGIVTMSPDDAWRTLQRRDSVGQIVGLMVLPEDCRYLLSAHRERMNVGRNGITLRKSFGGATYRSAELAALQHREVTVYFDPEIPEAISIMTERNQVLTVPRIESVDAFNAEPEEFSAAAADVGAWNRTLRARLSQIRSDYQPPARGNLVDPGTAARGRQMQAQRAAISKRQEESDDIMSRGRSLARQNNLPMPSTPASARQLVATLGPIPEHEDV